MAKKTYVVTGATGHIGTLVAKKLEALGHQVRRISRSTGVDIDDAAALTRAFAGADGAFVMIPPEIKAKDIRARQNDAGAKLASAIAAAKTKRVAFLSSIHAQYKEGTGPILGLHDMEERLSALGIPELVFLRPAFFLENHLSGLKLIAEAGIYGTAFRPDLALPMIATRDIAEKAAEFLGEDPFREPRVRELFGARDYTMAEAARILGQAVGKPELKYVQFPYEDARKAMIGAGLSASYANSLLEMARSNNEGKLKPAEARSAQNTTQTTLEQFAQETFKPAYEAAAGAAAAR